MMRSAISTVLALALALAAGAPVAAAQCRALVYPHSTPAQRPAGVGEKIPARAVNTYTTTDDFDDVTHWYRDHLCDALEQINSTTLHVKDEFIGQDAVGWIV